MQAVEAVEVGLVLEIKAQAEPVVVEPEAAMAAQVPQALMA
jgi:hypothetical protein